MMTYLKVDDDNEKLQILRPSSCMYPFVDDEKSSKSRWV
jgi:hypothetical protein